MLGDHREKWGPLGQEGEFAKELAINGWRRMTLNR